MDKWLRNTAVLMFAGVALIMLGLWWPSVYASLGLPVPAPATAPLRAIRIADGNNTAACLAGVQATEKYLINAAGYVLIASAGGKTARSLPVNSTFWGWVRSECFKGAGVRITAYGCPTSLLIEVIVPIALTAAGFVLLGFAICRLFMRGGR